VSEKRRLVATLTEREISERRACLLIGVPHASQRYQAHASTTPDEIRDRIVMLAQAHPRYGYRRVTALLRREGAVVNHKRVRRIWADEGLILPRKRVRKRLSGERGGRPTRALHRGHVWTYDFIFDQTERGQVLKMLVVLDEFTRECHRIQVETRLVSRRVIDMLRALMARHGPPGFIRSDNGPEFIAAQLRTWLDATGTATLYIEPGHPWENGLAESFNGKFRDECLNQEVFWHPHHAQIVVEQFRQHYNDERPHSALGYRTPAEVAATDENEGTILLRKDDVVSFRLTSELD